MLIRNVKSFSELQQKKLLQAELLKVQIENEALQEKRVADYQNPNKPPPIPPQYKTASELAEDSLYQQRQAIDNLRSLNINYGVAATVSQELLQLPDGVGNLVKLNKNFPLIKSDIQKKFDPKFLDSQMIMEYLKDFFDELDTAIGLNLGGSNPTNYFQINQPLFTQTIIPNSENYKTLLAAYDSVSPNFVLNARDTATLNSQFASLIAISPTEDQLKFIDTLPSLERIKLNKRAASLSKKIPSTEFILSSISKFADLSTKINAGQDTASLLPDFKSITASLLRSFGSVSQKDQDNLEKFVEQIVSQQDQEIQAQASLTTPAGVAVINPKNQRPQIVDENDKYIRGIVNSQKFTNAQSRLRITSDKTQQVKWVDNANNPQDTLVYGRPDGNGDIENTYLNQVPTTDGQPPAADFSNVIFEGGKTELPNFSAPQKGQPKVFNNTYRKVANSLLPCPVLIDGTPVDLAQVQRDTGRSIEEYLLIGRFNKAQIGVSTNSREIATVTDPNTKALIPKIDEVLPFFSMTDDGYKDAAANQRYTKEQLKDIIFDMEVNTVIPERLREQDSYDPMHIKSQQLIPSQGFGLKKGFNAKRIKVGKGVVAPKQDIPRYRTFGKYIIHYPHLIEESVLNLKFPSAGSIPNIKPVKIEENYKQFIEDILDTNKVNKRHYDSLTKNEKDHFIKIARGAKITSLLTFKPEETEDEDYKRLELCLGEINAGNDNPKIVEEVKQLLKRFVENGRVSKLKAADILLQL